MRSLRALISLLLLAAAAPAWAQQGSVTGQGGELYSIEKRDLMGHHELMLSVGVLPMDAVATGLTLQGSYSYHFSHLIAWEIIGGTWSFNFDTGVEQRLKDEFLAQLIKEGELRWILHSNFVLKPLYGKFALTNDKLLSAEMYFVLGYAQGGYTAALPPGFDVGAGIRMFLGKYFSLRLDIRDYLFFLGTKEVKNNLFLSLGLSLTFGFGEEQKEE